MKKKVIFSALAVVLVFVLAGLFLMAPESNTSNNEGTTGAAVTNNEGTVDEFSELTNEELLDLCLNRCGKDSSSSSEAEIWSKMCNAKFNSGRETLIKFIESC